MISYTTPDPIAGAGETQMQLSGGAISPDVRSFALPRSIQLGRVGIDGATLARDNRALRRTGVTRQGLVGSRTGHKEPGRTLSAPGSYHLHREIREMRGNASSALSFRHSPALRLTTSNACERAPLAARSDHYCRPRSEISSVP
jgi:hypothetical protein